MPAHSSNSAHTHTPTHTNTHTYTYTPRTGTLPHNPNPKTFVLRPLHTNVLLCENQKYWHATRSRLCTSREHYEELSFAHQIPKKTKCAQSRPSPAQSHLSPARSHPSPDHLRPSVAQSHPSSARLRMCIVFMTVVCACLGRQDNMYAIVVCSKGCLVDRHSTHSSSILNPSLSHGHHHARVLAQVLQLGEAQRRQAVA